MSNTKGSPNPSDLIAIANPSLAKKLSADEDKKSQEAESSSASKPAAHTSFRQDIWKAVLTLNVLRYLFSMALIVMASVAILNPKYTIDALSHPYIFYASVICLVVSAVAFTICTKRRLLPLQTILISQFAIDIVAAALLMHAAGGLQSRFSWIFFIIVATGSVVLPRRQALGLASGAVIILIYEHIYSTFIHGYYGVQHHIDLAFYSLALMGTALAVSHLALQLRRAELKSYTLGDESIEEFLVREEIEALKSALKATSGNKTEAAKLVGMTFRSFRYKLTKYDIG